MTTNPDFDYHRRSSLRLEGHDYSTPGIYFVTICIENQANLLGQILREDFDPSLAGLMVESWWGNLTRRFPSIQLGPYVVMPNHIHGLIMPGATADEAHPTSVRVARRGHPASVHNVSEIKPPSIPEIVGWFKTMTTNDFIRGVRECGWPPFPKRLWHRGYHDHIVRNDHSLANIEEYIADNPRRWAEDRLNAETGTISMDQLKK